MKKILLCLLGATALNLSAGLHVSNKRHIANNDGGNMQMIEYPVSLSRHNPAKIAKAEAANTYDYSLADEPYTAIGFTNTQAGNKIAMAFEMPKAVTTEFAGSTITHINFYTGVNANSGKNEIPEVTVFISEDANHATAACTKTAKVSSTRFGYYSVELDEPYTIVAGTDIYVGCYSLLTKPTDYTIVVDYMMHNDSYGGWVSASASESADFVWDNLSGSYGFVCVSAILQGDNFPQNKITFDDFYAPSIVKVNEEFEVEFGIKNKGQNPVESLEVEYTVGAEQPKTVAATLAAPLATNKFGVATATMSVPLLADSDVNVKITKVNGADVSDHNLKTSFHVFAMDENPGYVPNVVIEEFTGAWCGWCPTGIVGMEYVREKYTDGSYIPVAVHYNDAMQSATYFSVLQRFGSGSFPSAIINRDFSREVYSFVPVSYMDAYYEEARSVNTPVEVTINCNYTDSLKNAVVFEGTTKFSMDLDNPNFILSFGVTEDNVGPYNQTNNYYGQNEGLGIWDTAGTSVSNVYNDVGRLYRSINGIAGTVPASVKAGEENPYSYTMSLTKSLKREDLNFIVYVTNTKTGQIFNAAMIKGEKAGVLGITDIAADLTDDAPVEYYNLQGIKVQEPTHGIYIRRQGNKAEKIAVN